MTDSLNKNTPGAAVASRVFSETFGGERQRPDYTPSPEKAKTYFDRYLEELPQELRETARVNNTKMITDALALTETQKPDAQDHDEGFSLTAYMPELPKVARLSEKEIELSKNAGQWIDRYSDFAAIASPMTPALFHKSYALALLATAIARRVYVKAGDEMIYPNLYMLLIAPSTLYAKTTGLNVGIRLLEMAGMDHMLLPTGVTPQSLISELTTKSPVNFNDWTRDSREDWQAERKFAAQRAWWMDEAASLLDLFKQKHTADLLGMILKMYGCPQKLSVSTIARGRETVRFSYLTICGPTTPAAMRGHLKNAELWGDGLFARFLMVTPDTKPVDAFYAQTVTTPPDLAKHLNLLAFTRLKMPEDDLSGSVKAPPAVEAGISPEVWNKWQAYKSGIFAMLTKRAVPEKLYAVYGRLHTTAIKIAMLLAASDYVEMAEGNPISIRLEHWARAQIITEEYRASLHRLVDDASRPDNDDDQELAQKIITRVRSSSRNSRRELAQDLHMSIGIQRTRLDMIIAQIINDEIIEEREVKKKSGPGAKRLFIK